MKKLVEFGIANETDIRTAYGEPTEEYVIILYRKTVCQKNPFFVKVRQTPSGKYMRPTPTFVQGAAFISGL